VSSFYLAAHYLRYRLKAFKLHGVHSPFIFDLYHHVIRHTGHYHAYGRVEALREKLLQDTRSLQVTDLGAGTRTGKQRTRRVSRLARTSAKPLKYGQLLFRLVNYFQPHTILDLGTSLGITTSYLAEARRQAQLYTFEGCPATARLAQEHFKHLGHQQIKLVVGNLDETLEPQLEQLPQVDFVFFDGNHRYEPTMRYFNACLVKHHAHSVFVVDDLYWSAEMKCAWEQIKKHPQVRQTVDMFYLGLVFFRTTQPREHFTLYY